MKPAPELPLLDEHSVGSSADLVRVWDALPEGIAAAFDTGWGRVLAGLLGCRERSGDDPFAPIEGAMMPGFRVAHSDPPREIALEGRHRFSDYRLTFEIEPRGAGSRIRAVTHARFPGIRGAFYRALVVGSGGHRIATRRILNSIARRAERAHRHCKEEA